MSDNPFSTLANDYAAALDWWREAGVDCDFADTPQTWLRTPAVEQQSEPAPPPRTVPPQSATPALDRALARETVGAMGGDPAGWPADLATFRVFWLTEPSLDPGPLGERIAAAGAAGAQLMVLVGQPDDSDRESLLSGAQGALLGRILRAMGMDRSTVYIASAVPRPVPLPDWDDLAVRGLVALTRHHIALAAPQRLIAFGTAMATLAKECGVPVLEAPPLETLARSPAQKRRFWTAWLEWSA